MDLAKIRKKSLQTCKETGDEPVVSPSSLPGLIKNEPDTVPASPDSPDVDFFHKEYLSTLSANIGSDAVSPVAALPEHGVATSTPLEAILAGRTAAGCDDESIITDDVSSEIAAESQLEFLCFRVSDEIYGINIMDIKEIIKPREVTEIPRAPLFVSGVLSLRGTIIPIIDMRVRLGLNREGSTGKERIVVIKNSNSFSGLLVDEVIQVVKVPLNDVEDAPAILDGIDRDFISGLARSDGRLIILLNLGNIADINLY